MMSMELPEELVEKSLAMMPFPNIFKARALSKSWLARLSGVSSQDDVEGNKRDDEEEKNLAISFQRQMGEYWSTKWPTFCPVFIGKEELAGYDRASHRWRRLPSLCFLPENHLAKSEHSYPQIHGALMLIVIPKDSGPSNDLFVANVLTRSWKELPRRPWSEGRSCGEETLVSLTETYKVIDFCKNDFDLFALIYNSKVDAWIKKTIVVPPNFQTLGKGEYLNGVLYWVIGAIGGAKAILACNVEDETFRVGEFPPPDLPIVAWDRFYLVACAGILLMVLVRNKDFYFEEYVIVVRIDLERPRWVDVTRGPPAAIDYSMFCERPVSDGDCIFFVGRKPGGNDDVVVYNVQNDEWSSVDLPAIPFTEYTWDSSFQPGLNPFMAP